MKKEITYSKINIYNENLDKYIMYLIKYNVHVLFNETKRAPWKPS